MLNEPVKVALIGMSENAKKRLESAFDYSKTRRISYIPCELPGSEPAIFMVNADEPENLETWMEHTASLEEKNSNVPPSVMVSGEREYKTEHYRLRCPLISSRIIGMLDEISENELTVHNDVAILADDSSDTVNISDAEFTRTAVKKERTETRDAGRKILVVDDSLPVRIQMDQALKEFDADVDFAKTGEEAFEYINSNTYAIIFLDVVLPGVDGYEICKVIKEGEQSHTPVIMLTSNSSPQDKIKGKLAGCDTYLIKPVGKVIFREVVNQYLL